MKNIKMALIAGICASSFALSGCFAVNMAEEQPPSLNEETTSIYTEQSAPPTDGSSPAAYSGLENVAFMAYRLANGQYYSSEATSEVKTSIGFITYTQQVETYKDYYDGVMVVSDVSKSTLVNNALQSCFIGDRVLWRSPASSKPKDWNGRATEWDQDTPTNCSLDEYMQLYGLPSTEFSVYTLNAQTLSKWSSVTDNGDGTYSQTIYPDVSTAGVYYSIRMKTMGGLSSYPTFQEISITYTFDRSWRVLSSVTEELYSVDLGVIHSDSCKAVTTQTYSYDRSKVDISAYTDFFSRFEQKKDDDVIDTPLEDEPVTSMTATDYLLQGCGPLLTGAQMFAVQATYNETEIAGSLYVNLASGEARGTIEGINVWYTDSKLYLGTGDAIVYLSPSKFTALAATFGGKGSSFNILGLLGDFQSAQIEENDLTVTVTASLNVSDSVLQTAFFFDRTEDGVVLNYVRIDTTAGDAAVSITLTVSDEEPIPALTAAQKAGATDISDALEYLGGLQTMIANKKLAITAAISTTVNGKTYEFDVSGNVDWSDGIKLSATVQTELFGSLREVTFYYIDGEISVVCGKIGVQMYVSDLEDIAAAVQEAAARVAELWNSSSEESQALGGAAVALAAVMEKVAQSGAFDQEEAVAWVKSVLQSLLQAAAQGAQGVKDAFALTYDGTAFTLTANGWEILGAPIGFTATLAAGKTSPALPQNVTMVTAEQFIIFPTSAVSRSGTNGISGIPCPCLTATKRMQAMTICGIA
jgi:hypothetical protein